MSRVHHAVAMQEGGWVIGMATLSACAYLLKSVGAKGAAAGCSGPGVDSKELLSLGSGQMVTSALSKSLFDGKAVVQGFLQLQGLARRHGTPAATRTQIPQSDCFPAAAWPPMPSDPDRADCTLVQGTFALT